MSQENPLIDNIPVNTDERQLTINKYYNQLISQINEKIETEEQLAIKDSNIVKLLENPPPEFNVNLLPKPYEDYTLLILACRAGLLNTVKKLVGDLRANVTKRTNKRPSAVLEAVYAGNPQIVEFLLRKKANPNTRTANGDCPIYAALALSKKKIDKITLKNMITLLVENGTDLNPNTGNRDYKEKRSPIEIAEEIFNSKDSEFYDPEYLNYLKNKASKPKSKIKLGTSFDVLSTDNRDTGKQSHTLKTYYENLLGQIRKYAHISEQQIEKEENILELLNNPPVGFNINFLYGPNKDFTLLMLACEEGLLKVVKKMDSMGADLGAKVGHNLYTAVLCAVDKKQYEVVEYLLSKGVDPNPRTLKGNAPVYAALKNKDKKMLTILEKNKTDFNIEFYENQIKSEQFSPIEIAEKSFASKDPLYYDPRYYDPEFFAYLKQAASDPNRQINTGTRKRKKKVIEEPITPSKTDDSIEEYDTERLESPRKKARTDISAKLPSSSKSTRVPSMMFFPPQPHNSPSLSDRIYPSTTTATNTPTAIPIQPITPVWTLNSQQLLFSANSRWRSTLTPSQQVSFDPNTVLNNVQPHNHPSPLSNRTYSPATTIANTPPATPTQPVTPFQILNSQQPPYTNSAWNSQVVLLPSQQASHRLNVGATPTNNTPIDGYENSYEWLFNSPKS